MEMTAGNIARGNRKMLKSDRATKALSAVRRLSGDWSASFKWIRTKVANVARATFG